jgi:hypothetical protein
MAGAANSESSRRRATRVRPAAFKARAVDAARLAAGATRHLTAHPDARGQQHVTAADQRDLAGGRAVDHGGRQRGVGAHRIQRRGAGEQLRGRGGHARGRRRTGGQVSAGQRVDDVQGRRSAELGEQRPEPVAENVRRRDGRRIAQRAEDAGSGRGDHRPGGGQPETRGQATGRRPGRGWGRGRRRRSGGGPLKGDRRPHCCRWRSTAHQRATASTTPAVAAAARVLSRRRPPSAGTRPLRRSNWGRTGCAEH